MHAPEDSHRDRGARRESRTRRISVRRDLRSASMEAMQASTFGPRSTSFPNPTDSSCIVAAPPTSTRDRRTVSSPCSPRPSLVALVQLVRPFARSAFG
eukprot:scaffold74475_cov32-Tisochrysis_lutea.AAC.3